MWPPRNAPPRLGPGADRSRFARARQCHRSSCQSRPGQSQYPLAAGEALRRLAPRRAACRPSRPQFPAPGRARAAGRARPHPSRPRVAYFVDVFANYNDPQIAESVVAVLQHNGIEVYVPPGQRGCGMPPLACGDIDAARGTVRHNLRLLADVVREDMPILCSEPTAALMLTRDAARSAR